MIGFPVAKPSRSVDHLLAHVAALIPLQHYASGCPLCAEIWQRVMTRGRS